MLKRGERCEVLVTTFIAYYRIILHHIVHNLACSLSQYLHLIKKVRRLHWKQIGKPRSTEQRSGQIFTLAVTLYIESLKVFFLDNREGDVYEERQQKNNK